jgi:DNA polymerase III epsilon subunit family exonuclease
VPLARLLARRRAARVHPALRRELGELSYAVVDVETTGLDPAVDRVLEVAVLEVGADGRVTDEYRTLVAAPSVDAVAVHGITAAHLVDAPRFAEVAAALRPRLDADLVVGHNVSFDLAFLRREFARCQQHLPPLPYLCTIALGRLLGLEPRRARLDAACRRQGIAVVDRHAALADARATAALLAAYLQHAEALELDLCALARRGRDASCASWRHPPAAARGRQRVAERAATPSFPAWPLRKGR